MKNKKYCRYRGFTLLELLVVIGIIGVMVALATVAYSTIQRSGRDSRRKQDLVAVQNALEQYYSANSFAYPNGTCSNASTYLKSSWPADPTNSGLYTYTQSCTGTAYCICALMEGTSAGNSSTTSCGWSTTTKTHYCVGNLQ